MTTSAELQCLMNVSCQHPVTQIQTLSTGFPACGLLLHNRSIWRKVHASELDVVEETVVAFHTFERDVVSVNFDYRKPVLNT